MLHGQLSNRQESVIGFRCEDCLLKYNTKGVLNTAKNIIKGKSHNATINPEVYSLMNYIYWKTEMTVSLVVDKKNYTHELIELVKDMPFNQVGLVLTSITEVTMMLNTGMMTYYVDTDPFRRHEVNNRNALSLEEMNLLIDRRVR